MDFGIAFSEKYSIVKLLTNVAKKIRGKKNHGKTGMVKISLGYEIYEKKSWELVRHKIFLTKIDNFSKKIG